MPAFPRLLTQRFTLRQIGDNDIEFVFKGLSHPEVIKYYGVSFKTLEETQEQINWYATLEKEDTGIWWAIIDQSTKQSVGACGFNDWHKVNRKAELGFWLLPDYWRKGVMTEVLPAVTQYAFETMKLNRIEAFVESENLACKKLLEKHAFILEGTMCECEFKDGQFITIDIYAQLRHSS